MSEAALYCSQDFIILRMGSWAAMNDLRLHKMQKYFAEGLCLEALNLSVCKLPDREKEFNEVVDNSSRFKAYVQTLTGGVLNG